MSSPFSAFIFTLIFSLTTVFLAAQIGVTPICAVDQTTCLNVTCNYEEICRNQAASVNPPITRWVYHTDTNGSYQCTSGYSLFFSELYKLDNSGRSWRWLFCCQADIGAELSFKERCLSKEFCANPTFSSTGACPASAVLAATNPDNSQEVCCQNPPSDYAATCTDPQGSYRGYIVTATVACATAPQVCPANTTQLLTPQIISSSTSRQCTYRACCSQATAQPDPPAATSGAFVDARVVDLTYDSLIAINPLRNSSVFANPADRTPGFIINRALRVIVFPLAGFALLLLILWSGFQILSGSVAGKQNSIDSGKKRLTTAIIGFVILLLVYWIWRLLALATGLAAA